MSSQDRLTDDAVLIKTFSGPDHEYRGLRSYRPEEFRERTKQGDGADILHLSNTAHSRWNEETTFVLLNSSFDTISDPAQCLGLADHTATSDDYSPGGRVREDRATTPTARASTRHHSRVDIALPSLTGADDTDNEASSESNLGDVSPVPVVFGNANCTTEATQDSTTRPIPAPLPLPGRLRLARSSPSVLGNPVLIPTMGLLDDPQGLVSNPFFVLRSSSRLFEGCKYLLPCTRENLCHVHIGECGHFRRYREKANPGLQERNQKVGERRVGSAICAFGDNVRPKKQRFIGAPPRRSIFRARWSAFSSTSRTSSSRRQKYERILPSRYRIRGSLVSWELEEDPPVWPVDEASVDSSSSTVNPGPRDLAGESCGGGGGSSSGSGSEEHRRASSPCSMGATATATATACRSISNNNDNQMKYRCKLCGKPKQNHNCPFSPSLQRSIGVMVYPAVNAYTAAEPGTVAPALTSMNNFVSYEDLVSSDQTSSPEPAGHYSNHFRPAWSTARPVLGRYDHHHHHLSGHFPTSSVTPETQEPQRRCLGGTGAAVAAVAAVAAPTSSSSFSSPHSATVHSNASSGHGGENAGHLTSTTMMSSASYPRSLLSSMSATTTTATAKGQWLSSPGDILTMHRSIGNDNVDDPRRQDKHKKRAHDDDNYLYFDPAGYTPSSTRRGSGRWAVAVGGEKHRRGNSSTTTTTDGGGFGWPLFAPAVTLRPEHYRAINSSSNRGHCGPSNSGGGGGGSSSSSAASLRLLPLLNDDHNGADAREDGASVREPQQHLSADADEDSSAAYTYPAIPLTFGERTRLSDTLFILSREVPSWTSDIAVLLDEARGRGRGRSSSNSSSCGDRGRHNQQEDDHDDWDQAVAELLTQVVVGLYCSESDEQLDGLQQYLLALGIAC